MKKILFLAATLFVTSFASAQTSVRDQYPGDESAEKIYLDAVERQTKGVKATKTSWVSNRARDNWFISFGGGVGMLHGDNSEVMDFSDRIGYQGNISIGKWVNPALGFRLNISGSQLQGFAPTDGKHGDIIWYTGSNYNVPGHRNGKSYTQLANYSGADGQYIVKNYFDEFKKYGDDEGYNYEVLYGAASFDALWNLKNTFTQYNPKAFFNPVLYAGLGYAHTIKDDDRTAVNSIMGKVGLQLNFRLHDRWDFYLDAHGMILPENFDRQVGGEHSSDIVTNVTAGFTYKFNFRHFIKADFNDPTIVDGLNRKINELRDENERLRNRPVPTCPECPEPKVIVEEKIAYLPTPVFFSIGSSKITPNQYYAIDAAAKFLKENSSYKLELTGYADKATGSEKVNQKLSQQRVEAVAKMLVDKHGIDKARLITEAKGDKVQPFKENDWNRVVIFVTEK